MVAVIRPLTFYGFISKGVRIGNNLNTDIIIRRSNLLKLESGERKKATATEFYMVVKNIGAIKQVIAGFTVEKKRPVFALLFLLISFL